MPQQSQPIDPLEERLQKLAPAPPAAELLARLAATQPAPARRFSWWWLWLALPATAVLVIVTAIHFRAPRPTTGPVTFENRFRPVERENYLFGGREVGIYHAPDGRAYRLVQTIGVNRQVWENVADRSRVEHEFPEQRWLLVSMNTY